MATSGPGLFGVLHVDPTTPRGPDPDRIPGLDDPRRTPWDRHVSGPFTVLTGTPTVEKTRVVGAVGGRRSRRLRNGLTNDLPPPETATVTISRGQPTTLPDLGPVLTEPHLQRTETVGALDLCTEVEEFGTEGNTPGPSSVDGFPAPLSLEPVIHTFTVRATPGAYGRCNATHLGTVTDGCSPVLLDVQSLT